MTKDEFLALKRYDVITASGDAFLVTDLLVGLLGWPSIRLHNDAILAVTDGLVEVFEVAPDYQGNCPGCQKMDLIRFARHGRVCPRCGYGLEGKNEQP